MYRDLIGLRRNLPGVTRGLCGQGIHIYHFNDAVKLMAFHRWDKQGPTDSVVVVVNMTNRSWDEYVIGFPRAGWWKTRFNSDSYNYDPNFANHPCPDVEAREVEIDGLPCSATISIGPYTVVIYSTACLKENGVWPAVPAQHRCSAHSWQGSSRSRPVFSS